MKIEDKKTIIIYSNEIVNESGWTPRASLDTMKNFQSKVAELAGQAYFIESAQYDSDARIMYFHFTNVD